MADGPLLARMNAAIRQVEALCAEAMQVKREAAERVSALRHASARLREAMDQGAALRVGPDGADPSTRGAIRDWGASGRKYP